MSYMEVVIKDGNRTVNWIFPDTRPVESVLEKFEREYLPVNRKRVFIENRRLIVDCAECQLNYFVKSFGRKIRINVETVKPLKKEDEKTQNG